ncbi:MAG: nucleotidyltransferase domain-containing protein [bacterium]
MVEEGIVKSVQRYLRSLQDQGVPVSFGVVFGSQATGKTADWSDIDLLVVSPRFDGPRSRKDIDLLWHLAARTDIRIEPLACGERQWYDDDSSPLIESARREGEQIKPAAIG